MIEQAGRASEKPAMVQVMAYAEVSHTGAVVRTNASCHEPPNDFGIVPKLQSAAIKLAKAAWHEAITTDPHDVVRVELIRYVPRAK